MQFHNSYRLSHRRAQKHMQRYSRNRGVVLVVALVVLVILIVSSVGLMRSVDSSITQSGALGFKRDAANVAEQTLSKILPMFENGAFDFVATPAATQANNNALNYSATLLTAVNPDGIPTVMLDTAIFDASYTAAPANLPAVPTVPLSMRVRYLIERMCTLPGPSNSTNCILSGGTPPGGGSQSPPISGTQAQYRVTIKVESAINDALASYVQAVIGYRP